MKKIILASNNLKKIKEIKEILKGLPYEVYSLKDMNIDIEVEEDGLTFEENAKKKAKEIHEYLLNKKNSDFIVLSDDSGLEVDCLNGAPGIYSARYAGEHGNDYNNNVKLLEDMKAFKGDDRSARFVCVIAVVFEDGNVKTVRGEVEGRIIEELKTEGGFGYDPLFFYNGFNKTFGEATPEEKNEISHRGNALKKLKEILG
ncbi:MULTISPECIES: XTP/dITP diphosphatase [unclassified Clostridium]|jgi:XTP/dITP diphosphohydrolase|uniref:XTP/dITP diphosphatase n=1 Tax=Clostridium TaxID=1485 RepID=UPI001C8CCC16|nr:MULTISPECIES: XTP/dITP diphosphatase [unclassified Clostridium]MBX9139326.1 XTP/dITP diphosphatase [Clostridium sp. K12(2020)]MBX9145870.1 XTP/dITP diphosphatase [Clostridium sp. K13]MDU2292009.1 XTP/dITP diphosphatase [Clostridium celatum]MDU4325685.1 XTP/dITP diphosphatase [Clostridium celatum]